MKPFKASITFYSDQDQELILQVTGCYFPAIENPRLAECPEDLDHSIVLTEVHILEDSNTKEYRYPLDYGIEEETVKNLVWENSHLWQFKNPIHEN
jgi:hypothetical protein